MFYSLLVYSLLILFLYFSSFIAGRNSLQYERVAFRRVWFPILCVSLVLGGRYNVGTDWENYRYIFDYIQTGKISESALEPFYLCLNYMVSILGLSASYFFTLVVFLQLTLVYYVFRDNPKIFALGVLFYLLCLLPISLNIIRQSIAICIFFYATRFIESSAKKYLLMIIIAGLFHYSSLVLLPVFLLRHKIFAFLDKRYISIPLYIATLFLGSLLIVPLLELVPIDLLGAKYQNSLNNADIEMTVNSGLGIMINNFLHVCILLCLPLFNRFPEKKSYLLIVYRIFLVGLLFSNIFGVSEYLSRLVLPLVSLKVILLPYVIYSLLHTSKNYEFFSGIIFVLLYILLFVFSVLNGAGGISPFMFKWIQ